MAGSNATGTGRFSTASKRERNDPRSKSNQSKLQNGVFSLLLLSSLAAVFLTASATQSADIVRQVLSQSDTTKRRKKQNEEPYGYASISDDTGKAGFWRHLTHASFYEYRLPKAFLKVSLHSEELSAEAAQELQFRAGLRKRPANWTFTAPKRNIFVDEPYRDKGVDRLFKRSRRKMYTSLILGIFSSIIMMYSFVTLRFGNANDALVKSDDEEQQVRNEVTPENRLSCKPISWAFSILQWAFSPMTRWYLRRDRMSIALVSVSGLLGTMVAAGTIAASALRIILRHKVFCPMQKCASNLLGDSSLLEFDACIEKCVLGEGGNRAKAAIWLWGLCVLLTLMVAVATATALPSSSRSISLRKQNWWRILCLPLAITPDQISSLVRHKAVHDQ